MSLFLRRPRLYNGGASQADNGGGQEPPKTITDPPKTEDAQDVSKLPEWAQESMRKLRQEAAENRVKAKDRDELATKLKTFEDAQLSEQDRLKKQFEETNSRATALEAQLRQQSLNLILEREARKLNIVDPEAVTLFLSGKVEFDKDGQPQNVEGLLADLVKEKPYLVAAREAAPPPGAGASAANPGRSPGAQAHTFTKSQVADQTFYEANRVAIMQAMREGRILDG